MDETCANIAAARHIIWLPDDHSLEAVAEAALTILSNRFSDSRDTHQASHLISTFHPR